MTRKAGARTEWLRQKGFKGRSMNAFREGKEKGGRWNRRKPSSLPPGEKRPWEGKKEEGGKGKVIPRRENDGADDNSRGNPTKH